MIGIIVPPFLVSRLQRELFSGSHSISALKTAVPELPCFFRRGELETTPAGNQPLPARAKPYSTVLCMFAARWDILPGWGVAHLWLNHHRGGDPCPEA